MNCSAMCPLDVFLHVFATRVIILFFYKTWALAGIGGAANGDCGLWGEYAGVGGYTPFLLPFRGLFMALARWGGERRGLV